MTIARRQQQDLWSGSGFAAGDEPIRSAAMNRMHGCRRARGVSLIEVLVSLVILSLGVLAVVALQLIAKRNNADAGQRTLAAQFAYDLIERMRTNSSAEALEIYGSAVLGGNQEAPTPLECTESAQCSATDLAKYDLAQWELALRGAAERIGDANVGGLVSPTVCIAAPGTPPDGVYTITIVWRGTIELEDRTDIACGRDPQGNGPPLYSKVTAENDNVYRRAISFPVYITARQPSA